jgi:hypothetical protein
MLAFSFILWLIGSSIQVSLSQDAPQSAARLIVTRCLTCHAGSEPEGGLDLSSHSAALRGGESGAAIDEASPMASRIWMQIESGEMPPEDPLSPDEKEIVRQWLIEGAPYPKDALDRYAFTTDRRAGADWWSFQPLPNHSSDLLAPDPKHHPVDVWIDRALKPQGWQQAESATPRTLVRRLYYDLTGLPPSFEVIEAFDGWNWSISVLLLPTTANAGPSTGWISSVLEKATASNTTSLAITLGTIATGSSGR